MSFWTFTWKNLARRPVRLTLTVAGLALAVCAIVSLVGIAEGFERSIWDLYHRRGIDLVVQHAGGVMLLTRGVDYDLKNQIEQVPGVLRADGGLTDIVALEKFDLYAVLINGWVPESPTFNRIKTTAGRNLREGDQGVVMLGNVLAANTAKGIGDRIELYGEEFEIIGIFESFSVYENGAVFILLDELQRLTGRRGKVTGFLVETAHPDDQKFLEETCRRIEQIAPQIDAVPTTEFVQNVSQIRVARAAAWVTSAIAIMIGVTGTLNTLLMSVSERVIEIGTLRAIGWRKRRVVAMVLIESLYLSAAGAVIGVALGLLVMRLMAYWPKVAGLVSGDPPLIVLAQACAAAVLVGLLGAAYPAFWAAQLKPIQSMRAK